MLRLDDGVGGGELIVGVWYDGRNRRLGRDLAMEARMSTKNSLILGLLIGLALAGPALAQDIALPGDAGLVSGITAHGHGMVKLRPDIAYATVTVVTQSRDQAQSIADNSTTMKAVLAALKASDIADKDIQTQFYTVEPQYDYRSTPAVLAGYQVTNALRVTFHDVAKIGVVLDKATRAGATSVGGVAFDLSDRHRAEGDALALAVADARSKADLMAGAAGVELGHLISLSEGSVPQLQPLPIFKAAVASAELPSSPTEIAPQMIQIDADATVVFSISTRQR